jgi:hypothetical protein
MIKIIAVTLGPRELRVFSSSAPALCLCARFVVFYRLAQIPESLLIMPFFSETTHIFESLTKDCVQSLFRGTKISTEGKMAR